MEARSECVPGGSDPKTETLNSQLPKVSRQTLRTAESRNPQLSTGSSEDAQSFLHTGRSKALGLRTCVLQGQAGLQDSLRALGPGSRRFRVLKFRSLEELFVLAGFLRTSIWCLEVLGA